MTGFADERLIEMGNVNDELLDINCGRCGRTLRVRIADLGDARFVECEAYAVQHAAGVRCV